MDVIKDGQWKAVKWQDLTVGDIVKIVNNTFFPADMILLSSRYIQSEFQKTGNVSSKMNFYSSISEPQSMSFIETSNLDGETNLKIRQGVPATAKFLETRDLVNFNGTLECEPPNRHLYEFNGVLKEQGKM